MRCWVVWGRACVIFKPPRLGGRGKNMSVSMDKGGLQSMTTSAWSSFTTHLPHASTGYMANTTNCYRGTNACTHRSRFGSDRLMLGPIKSGPCWFFRRGERSSFRPARASLKDIPALENGTSSEVRWRRTSSSLTPNSRTSPPRVCRSRWTSLQRREIRRRCVFNDQVFAGEASLLSGIDCGECDDVIWVAVGEGASGAVLFRCRWRAGALRSLAEGSMPRSFRLREVAAVSYVGEVGLAWRWDFSSVQRTLSARTGPPACSPEGLVYIGSSRSNPGLQRLRRKGAGPEMHKQILTNAGAT